MYSIFLFIDLIGNYYIYTNITLSYLILYIQKRKYINIYFVLILGFIYDLLFTRIYFLHSLIYYIIYLIVNKYRYLNTYILGIITITLSIIINYLFSLILNHTSINILCILEYIIINYVLYVLISNKKIRKLI